MVVNDLLFRVVVLDPPPTAAYRDEYESSSNRLLKAFHNNVATFVSFMGLSVVVLLLVDGNSSNS